MRGGVGERRPHCGDIVTIRLKYKFPCQRAGRTPPPGRPVPLGTGGRAVVPYSPQTAAFRKIVGFLLMRFIRIAGFRAQAAFAASGGGRKAERVKQFNHRFNCVSFADRRLFFLSRSCRGAPVSPDASCRRGISFFARPKKETKKSPGMRFPAPDYRRIGKSHIPGSVTFTRTSIPM